MKQIALLRPWSRSILLALVLMTCTALPADAHADLIGSDPEPGVVLQRVPTQIHLWFSEDINSLASRIVVWDKERTSETAGDAHAVPGHPRELVTRLKPLPPGTYLVLWTSVSADDGHLLRGYFSFSVIVQGPSPSVAGVPSSSSQTFPDLVTLNSLIAHWLELLAAVTWVGAAAFSAIMFLPIAHPLDNVTLDREHRRARALILATLLVLFLSSAAVVLTRAYGIAGDTWQDIASARTLRGVLADQYGQVWIARQVLIVIAMILCFRPARRATVIDTRQEIVNVQTIVGLGYLYSLAASGHAASAAIGALPGHEGELFSLSILMDWLHYLADAAWLGGQVYLVIVLIPALRLRTHAGSTPAFLRSLDRFSAFAFASVATYAVSGIFAAKVHIPSWYAFFNSVYGRALTLKSGLIGLMILTSVLTVFFVRPRLRSSLRTPDDEARSVSLSRQLVRWLHVNPVLGAGVLLATSVMFSYPVPPGLTPPGPSTFRVAGDDLKLVLTLSPARAGPNTMTITLRTANDRPIPRAHVTLLTTMLDMKMGSGIASLRQTSPGRFEGRADLGMGGRWRFRILVYRPAGLSRLSVEGRVGT